MTEGRSSVLIDFVEMTVEENVKVTLEVMLNVQSSTKIEYPNSKKKLLLKS